MAAPGDPPRRVPVFILCFLALRRCDTRGRQVGVVTGGRTGGCSRFHEKAAPCCHVCFVPLPPTLPHTTVPLLNRLPGSDSEQLWIIAVGMSWFSACTVVALVLNGRNTLRLRLYGHLVPRPCLGKLGVARLFHTLPLVLHVTW